MTHVVIVFSQNNQDNKDTRDTIMFAFTQKKDKPTARNFHDEVNLST